MNRRHFLQSGVAAVSGIMPQFTTLPAYALAAPDHTPSSKIIDAHIHLFDTARPGGVPWPLAGDVIFKPALPARYEALARPQGIVGAIAIEASPVPQDNDWLLHTAQASPFIVGVIGDLVPTSNQFVSELARLRQNPLFLGIREGNLWKRSLSVEVRSAQFWTSVREISNAGLVFESANPDLPLLEALAILVGRMPELTVVIDHLPHMPYPSAPQDQRRFSELLITLGKAPRCFAKLSEIPDHLDGRPVLDLSRYQARLDQLWNNFGADKLIFGSDWPNSDHTAGFPEILGLVKRYISGKDAPSQEKLFFGNSKDAYRWRPRLAGQSSSPAL